MAKDVDEWVDAQRRAGDPRADEYDATRRAARSAAARKGAATRAAKKVPAKRATKRAASVPVSGTPRFRGGGPFAPPPVSAATMRMPRPASAPTVGFPAPTRLPAAAAPAAVVPPTVPAVRGRRGLTAGQRDAVGAGHAVSNRQQTNALMGRPPGRVASTVGGAAGGAATGATLGSVVPGVGTAVGAGVGAAVGGAGGAVSGARRRREYRRATAAAPGARRALVAEFTVCMLIVALSPLTDRRKSDPPAAWMKRMAALMAVFLILGLISAMGRGGARTAAAFGGLVAVVLAVSERDLFVKVADIFGGVPQDATLLPARTPINPNQPPPGGVFS